MTVEPAPPEVYNAFLRGVDLASIRMVKASFEASVARPVVKRTTVDVAFNAGYTNVKGGFEAKADFTFTFRDTEQDASVGTVVAAYVLRYTSEQPMSEDLWIVFGGRNLRLNAWPYAREFAQMATLRMEWPKFTLPVTNSAKIRAKRATPAAT